MNNFVKLILEGLDFGRKKPPKPKATMSRRVSTASTWQHIGVKPKHKRIIPKKLSMFGTRKLINDTNKTRSVWDKDEAAKKFYSGVYKRI